MSLSSLVRALILLTPALAAADWPQWRGPSRDGVAPSTFAPARWPKAPVKVWSLTLGPGHAGPVVAGGVVIQHFREGGNEVVGAFDLDTGRALWRDVLGAPHSPLPEAASHGSGPFATPTVADGRVFTLGVRGALSAYDLKSGRRLWRKEWSGEFAATQPLYGASASPLVVDGKVIVYAGGPGKGALLALDAATGAERFRLGGDGPPYGAAVMGVFSSVRQVITQSQGTLMGVDPATGARLWQRPFPAPYDQTIQTPVIDGDRILLSAYDVDLRAFKVSRTGAGWSTDVVWGVRQPLYMSSPVLAEGRLYGLTHLKRGQIFALDSATGRTVWSSPGGMGEQAALIVAGSNLLAFTEDGRLHVLERGDAYRPVATYTVADGATWAHPALLPGGRLLIKDARGLTLWDFGTAAR